MQSGKTEKIGTWKLGCFSLDGNYALRMLLFVKIRLFLHPL